MTTPTRFHNDSYKNADD
ncbi:hypothetical protein CGLO_14543 [Colletotrichum gloeosporioides Cg-14]|uniref:Uncharacterized protein n=1 Tax=Colletotrichum gloeosporioides (strain Cg-14) TaxID=1237896 RepID=T0K3Q3_COLGC|nr:hypothetical protein CGLO_14543 [Colletotrichum gloeosporioides Cg-14]